MRQVGASAGIVVGQGVEERRPAAPLAAVVSVVYVKQIAADEQPFADLSVPNGCVELRCRPGSMPMVVGPQNGPLSQLLAPGAAEIGIRFHPGAAALIIGMPISELVDQTVSFEDVFGRATSTSVADRIAESGSSADALRLLQLLVMDRLTEVSDSDRLVGELVRRLMPWRGRDVNTVSAELGMSQRQLRRRCQASIGLGPKVLHRLLRFQGFLALSHQSLTQHVAHRGYDLAGLAADAGYTDQSHLTRECVRLTNQTPSGLLDEFGRDCVGHDHDAWYEPMMQNRKGAAPW